MKNYFGRRNAKQVVANTIAVGETTDPDLAEKHDAEKDANHVDEEPSLSRVPSADAQAGVKKIEAVTLTWTKNELIVAYALLVATISDFSLVELRLTRS